MSGTKFCYIDDIKFPKLAQPGMFSPEKAFGFAAYVADADGLRGILRHLDADKIAAGLHPQDPIKRSMDDAIKNIYKRMYGDEGLERFKIAKKAANPIGRSVLAALRKHGAKVYSFLSLPYSSTPEERDLTQWAFDMMLQRLGFAAREASTSPSLVITMDQPIAVELQESFRTAYFHGQTTSGGTNFCGPLTESGVLSSLNFASTPYSPPLQVADFIAGACRDFVRWCRDGKKTKEVANSFLPLIPAFAASPSGQIEGYGMRLDPYPGFLLPNKLAELQHFGEEQTRQASSWEGF